MPRGNSNRAMHNQDMTFRKLLQPMAPEEFFEHAYGKLAVHIPGHADKLAHMFSWDELNRLFNQPSLWSDRTIKMVLSGRDLKPEEFCTPGRTREGTQAMLPDPERVARYLQQGATLVLDLVERLSPGIAALAASLETVLGHVAVCNVYCSWKAHQGFTSHFDTTDVFALHIAGKKTWHLYEGRYLDPIEGSGFDYASLPPEEHESAKGELLKSVEMTPGDVLYIPRGQYHDAVATSEASLHLSFGLVPHTGHDFMTVLLRSLFTDPLFRQAMPHFDDTQAYDAHLRRLAERLYEIITDAATARQSRQEQRRRVLRDSLTRFALPQRDPVSLYRVRWVGATLQPRGDGSLLTTASGEYALSGNETKIVEWILSRDFFDANTLGQAFDTARPADVSVLTDKLIAADLIEVI